MSQVRITSSIRFCRAGSLGNGSGSSWTNAADYHDIDAQVALAGPGGEVRLLCTDDYFQAMHAPGTFGGSNGSGQFTINNGGTGPGPNRVKITGSYLDGRPGMAIFRSDRPDVFNGGETTDSNIHAGQAGFNVGGSYLILQFLGFKNMGQSCINFTGSTPKAGINLRDLAFKNVSRAIAAGDSGVGSEVVDSVFERIQAFGYSRSLIRLNRRNTNVLIRNLVTDSDWQDESFSAAVQIGNSSAATGEGNSYITIENAVSRNNKYYAPSDTTGPDGYSQGDGFIGEHKDDHITLRNCHSFDNHDGGFDFKSTNLLLDNCSATRCKRSIRTWGGDVTIRNFRSYYPGEGLVSAAMGSRYGGGTHIFLQDSAGPTRVIGGDFRNTTSGFLVDAHASGNAGTIAPQNIELERVRVESTDLSDAALYQGNTSQIFRRNMELVQI